MSFDDINNGADMMLYLGKYDPNIPGFEKLAAFKNWAYNFKSAPRDGMSLAHSKVWQHGFEWEDKEGGRWKPAEKSATKFSFKEMDTNIDLQATNDKWSARFTRSMNPNDWDVDARFYVENKCTKEWKVEGALETQSPDLGGFKLNTNMHVEFDKQKPDGAKKGEWVQQEKEFALDMCAQIDKDYFVGGTFAYDTKEGMGGYKVGAGANMDANNVWLNYDIDNQQAKAGIQLKDKERGWTHAYEAKYYGAKDKDNKAQEFFQNQPVKLAAGGRWQLNKSTGFNYAVEFSNTIHAQWKWDHKVDKNWKLAGHQSYDMANKGKQPYNLGIDVTYTL